MEAAFEQLDSLMQNPPYYYNMNDIMKALTVITLIMTIPNMVFGFYGMNVSHLPGAISFIPGIIAVIGCIVAWQFLKKSKLY